MEHKNHDHKSHDKVFYVTFSVVLGALTAIAVFIGMVAAVLSPDAEGMTPEQRALLAARIQPLGQAVTDPAALLKVAAGKPARAAYTGEEVATKVCASCHGTGVLGAPRTGDAAAWEARTRAAGGLEGLVRSAIEGKNSMPPRGGDMDLSDAEVKAAVEVLLRGA